MTVLSGVRVIDLSEYIAGPLAGMLLGDLGADVIKVEPPSGDRWRLQGKPYGPNEVKANLSQNRSKRSIALNLQADEGKQIVYRLVKSADVVLHNYRPGVAERLGVDYETLKVINEGIIYCHNTAFGTDGPMKNKGGYDILSTAATGFLTGPAGRMEDGMLQAGIGIPVADASSGMFSAMAICAALWQKERTGIGQRIDTSLFGSGIAVQNSRFTSVEKEDGEIREQFLDDLGEMYSKQVSLEDVLSKRIVAPQPAGSRMYFRAYETKDRPIVIACLNDRLRQRVADILKIQDPRFEDPNFDGFADEYLEKAEKVTKEIEKIMRTKTRDEWNEIFDAADVPCGPVNILEELFEDEQVLANDLIVELEHSVVGPIKMAGAPYKFSATPLNIHKASPALSEHAEEILDEIGYSPEEIKDFKSNSIVT